MSAAAAVPTPTATSTTTGDPEQQARARLLMRLTYVMLALAGLGAGASLLEPQNQLWVTALFYGAIGGWLVAVAAIARRGRVVLAAWLLATMFWLMVAVVTVLFGGLQGETAACFAVSVLLLGALVGGRSAIAAALVSAAW